MARVLLLVLTIAALAACESPRDRPSGGVARPAADASSSAIDASRHDVGGGPDSGGALGPSGVDSAHYYDELTPGEVAAICAWSTEIQRGPRQIGCSNGITVNIKSTEECISSYDAATSAHCPIGVFEQCMLSLNGDPCQIFSTTECRAFLACGRAAPDAGP